jgi:ubiquinone/menaquinone biosynthesis C-methylase UbiE
MAALYDRLAPDYERRHGRWLKHAGGEAQSALEAVVRALATPDTQLLDAGCGTGTFARALIAEGMLSVPITLLDPSEAMLARCVDLPAHRLKGRLENLPFDNGSFDIVTCAWALETTSHPDLALEQLCRVVRPGGVLCLTFCADLPARGLIDCLMRQALLWRGTGQFLSREHVIHTIETSGDFKVQTVPSSGPAATVIARRLAETSDTRARRSLQREPRLPSTKRAQGHQDRSDGPK